MILKNNSFIKYLFLLIKKTNNIFGLINFIIMCVLWMLPFLSVSEKTQMASIVLLISVIYAGYKVWIDLYGGNVLITMEPKPVTPGSYYGDGIVDPSQRIIIDFDIINRNKENIYINEPEVKRIIFHTWNMENDKYEKDFYTFPGLMTITPSITLGGEDKIKVRCDFKIICTWVNKGFKMFANSLKDFTNCKVEITLSWSDNNNQTYLRTYLMEDNLDEFKMQIREQWEKEGRKELLIVAGFE